MRLHNQYQRNSPWRDPAWRQNRVLDLLESSNPHRPSRRYDDKFIREYYRFLSAYRDSDGRLCDRLYAKNPDLYYAHELQEQEDSEWRAMAQGFILTGEPFEIIADYLEMAPELLKWYERLFFNVRDRLHAQAWITKTSLGTVADRTSMSDGSITMSQRESLYRMFGYYGGPLVLQVLISGHTRGTMPQKSVDVAGWFDDTFATLTRTKSVQAMQTMSPNKFNVMELVRLHSDMIRSDRELASGGSEYNQLESTVSTFLQCIPFTVASADGSDLKDGQTRARFGTGRVEPRAAEHYGLALGQVPPRLKMAEDNESLRDSRLLVAPNPNQDD